ncbi:MAG: cell division topological specificity factor MinE [Candidatus Gastranaerophilales bacterium]|nr:cell division topological specificity factor MinE [Candidatus Gastranaerophilales bacterium]
MRAINEMLSDIIVRCNNLIAASFSTKENENTSKEDAKNRLKLVLMHDRTNLDPATLSKMKDELVDVISKYVEIDREALDLNLESETNTIALVASIPVLRAKKKEEIEAAEREKVQKQEKLNSLEAEIESEANLEEETEKNIVSTCEEKNDNECDKKEQNEIINKKENKKESSQEETIEVK